MDGRWSAKCNWESEPIPPMTVEEAKRLLRDPHVILIANPKIVAEAEAEIRAEDG